MAPPVPSSRLSVCALTEQLRGQLRRGRGTVRGGGSESQGAGPGPPFPVGELHSPALCPPTLPAPCPTPPPPPVCGCLGHDPIPAPPPSPRPPRSTPSSITSLLGHIVQLEARGCFSFFTS